MLAEIADLEAAKETAAEFLRKYAPDYAANLRAERADSLSGDSTYNPDVQVQLVRVENGVPFRQDGAMMTDQHQTGFIDSYALNWTEDEIAFEPTDGLIGEGAAYAAYCEAVDAKLCWHMLPVAYVDYEQQYDLALCYDLASDPEVTAVGAKDGAIIAQEEDDALYEYGDAVNEAAKALAEYGVGFPGGSFEADRLITWREAAALLVELDGTHVWNEDDETILRCARNDRIALDAAALDSTVARGELIRALACDCPGMTARRRWRARSAPASPTRKRSATISASTRWRKRWIWRRPMKTARSARRNPSRAARRRR